MLTAVSVLGLNGFHGLEVTSANLDLVKTEGNFNGTVDIPNASILTIEIVWNLMCPPSVNPLTLPTGQHHLHQHV